MNYAGGVDLVFGGTNVFFSTKFPYSPFFRHTVNSVLFVPDKMKVKRKMVIFLGFFFILYYSIYNSDNELTKDIRTKEDPLDNKNLISWERRVPSLGLDFILEYNITGGHRER